MVDPAIGATIRTRGLSGRERLVAGRPTRGDLQQVWLNPTRSALVCALFLACFACRGDAQRGDVLLVSVDTLRPDHLGLYGYERATSPNVDRWFGNGAIYERAYTTEANTSPAVVSMLTGLLPQEHRVRLLYQIVGPEIRLLPDLLPAAFRTAAVVSNMVLADEALGIAGRFDHYDDYVDEREPYRRVFERNASRTTDAALRWLREQRDPGPVFLWVHYIDPHGPYHPPESWRKSFRHEAPLPIDPRRVPAFQREPGIEDGLSYVDRYDEEIAYLDSEIGRLLDGFAALRSIDAALVVFTADHGESMMEHERWFTHGYQVYEEIARIPLLLRGPGVKAGRYSGLVSLVDVAPTVLRFAGGQVPDSMPAVDLRDGAGLADDRVIYVEARVPRTQRRAAIHGSDKWTLEVQAGSGAPNQRRRFDLASDPGERQPMEWDEAGGRLGDVEAGLLDLIARDPDPAGFPQRYERGELLSAPKVAPDTPPEVLEKLRALGYVE